MTDIIVLARRHKHIASHYDGCEADHVGCLVNKLADEIERLRSRVEKLEKVRAATRFLINEDAGFDDPAEDGWWDWEKNCEALRAALKEAKP